MGTLACPPATTIGVLAPSRERFQSIADLLDESCVWLAEPAAGDPIPAVDTFVIDSDLLATDPELVRKWRERCRESVTSDGPLTKQGGAAFFVHAGRTPRFRECAGQRPVSPAFHRPGRVMIYQCADHLDADNPL